MVTGVTGLQGKGNRGYRVTGVTGVTQGDIRVRVRVTQGEIRVICGGRFQGHTALGSTVVTG